MVNVEEKDFMTVTVQFKTIDYHQVIEDLTKIFPGFSEVGSVGYTGNGISTATVKTDSCTVFSRLTLLYARSWLTFASISVGEYKEVR
jgi:hypothetical protein